MLGKQRDVLKGKVLESTVNVFELTCPHVPSGHFESTLRRSFVMVDKSGAPLYWDVSVFALAHAALVAEGAFSRGARTTDKSRLLADGRAGCQRCFGSGWEEMPDGTYREGCEHLPLSDSDKAEMALRRAARVEKMRAEMRRRVSRPRPVEGQPRPKKPKGEKLRCDSCGREVDTYEVNFAAGDTCGKLLDRYLNEVDDGKKPSLCDGKFEKVEGES